MQRCFSWPCRFTGSAISAALRAHTPNFRGKIEQTAIKALKITHNYWREKSHTTKTSNKKEKRNVSRQRNALTRSRSSAVQKEASNSRPPAHEKTLAGNYE